MDKHTCSHAAAITLWLDPHPQVSTINLFIIYVTLRD